MPLCLGEDKMEPIAIIGFAARLPGDATSAESFWQMLCEGRSAATEIPQTRFNIDAFYHPDPDRVDTVSCGPCYALCFPVLISFPCHLLLSSLYQCQNW